MKKGNKKKYSLMVMIVLILVLIGGSYAWLKLSLSGEKVNVIKAGTLSLLLNEINEVGIQEDAAIPVSDQTGLETEGFNFTLENNGTIASNYIIYLDDVDLKEGEERIPDSAIKYVLTKNGETSLPALLNTTGKNPNRKLDIGKLSPGEKNTYELKVWIDYNADNSIMGKVFSTKLRVESIQEIEGWDGESDSNKSYDMVIDLDNSEGTKIDVGDDDSSNYTYVSSDSGVVEIDENGNIIPIGPGEATITITNKETGETEEKIVKIEKTITAEFDVDEGVEVPTTSCKLTESGQTECTITLPDIEVSEDEEFTGWQKEGSDEVIPAGTKVVISEGTKFIPVIKQIVLPKTVTFEKNGIGIQSIGKDNLECEVEEDKCYVTLPEIVAKEGYEVVGWSTNKDIIDKTEEERSQIFSPGAKIEIEEDTTFYTISKSSSKTYTAKFYKNGAVSQDGLTDEYIEKSCTIESSYNNDEAATTCSVTSPNIVGSSNTPNVLGYATGATKTETILNVNTEFELSKNVSYYAITTNDSIIRSARFIQNGSGVTSIEGTNEVVKSCSIDQTYNGEKQNESCSITSPSFTVSEGYTARGWSQLQDASEEATDDIGLDGYLPVSSTIKLSSASEVNYYSISSKNKITYEVDFHLNGAGSQDGNTNAILTKSCNIAEVFNDEIQDTTCSITLPTITGSTNTPTVVGYAEDKDATVGIEGTEIIVSATSNKDYYAITKKESEPVYVNYILNNAVSFTLDSQKYTTDLNTLACNKPVAWNGASQEPCKITLPTIEGSTNTPTVIGWSDEASTHEAIYKAGQSNVDLAEDTTLYAQTKKNEVTYKIGSYNVGKNVSSINKDNAKTSCTIDATYNGVKQETSCTIAGDDLPTVTPKNGYNYAGWNNDSDSTTGGSTIITLTSENTEKDWYAYAIGQSFKIEYYSNGTKDSEETLEVSDSISLKVLEKEGYEFKGWDTDSSASTIVYPKGEKATDLNVSEGSVIKLYAVWVDETKPVCTWSVAPTTTTQNSAEIELSCVDKGSGLSSQTLSIEDFEISSSTYGEITSVNAPVSIENGYKYTITVKGLSNSTEGTSSENIPGEFNISLKANSISDNDNNGNASVTSDNILVYGRKYTATFTKNGNAVETISSTGASCVTKGTSITCDVTTPSITIADGYEIVGWNTDSNATTGTTAGKNVTLSSDATYYTIYKQSAKTYNAVFHLNGAATLDGSSSDITRNCTIDEVYNDSEVQATSCAVETPVIGASTNTPTVLGLATTSDEVDTSKMINTGNQVISISISSDVNYYAITKKDAVTYNVTYIKNGLGVTAVSKEKDECTIDATYNGNSQATICSITLPSITVENGYTAVGWATNSSEENENNIVSANTNINLDKDVSYYSISKKNPVTYTATFNLNGAGTQTNDSGTAVAENVTRTCKTDVTWNNNEPDVDCTITTPVLTGSTNTPVVIGYNTSKDATVSSVDQNGSLTLTSDQTYYAITKKDAVTLTADWNANGSTLSSTSQSTCNLAAVYNGASQDTSCTVTAPTITAPSNTPTILGFNTSSDANKNNSNYSTSTKKLTLTSSNTGNTWYAQTRKDEVTYTVGSFEIGTNVSSISSSASKSCTIAATYNGVAQATSCTITPPTITPKTGYTAVGWNTSSSSSASATNTITLNSNVDKYYAHATANTYTIKYYDGTTEKGTTSATVDNLPFTLTTKDALGLSKTGYTFKGWSKTSGGDVSYTDGQSITSNLATSSGAVVSLYAVWEDETKPVCTWSTAPTIALGGTANLTLTCTDMGSGVVSKTLSTSDFTVSNSKGSVTAVSAPTAVSNGYSYTVTVKGNNAGTFTTTIPANTISDNDKNGNAAKATGDITVSKGTSTPTVSMSGYTYGGTVSTPTINNNTSGGTVTYYYNTSNSTSGGTAWSTVTSSTSLNAGTYYLYAVVAATDDYEQVTTSAVSFTIAKASGYVTLNATSGSVSYGTSSSTFTVSNSHGGTLSVSDDNSTASSAISGSTVTISSLSSLAAGTTIKVTVKSAATTNYKEASTTYTLTINQKKATLTVANSSLSLTYGTNGSTTYTYDGDGTVSCSSSSTTYATCSVDTTNKKVTITPVSVTSSAVTITLSATAGTNYSAPDNKTISVTVAGVTRTATFNANGNTISTPSGCSSSGSGTSLKVTCSCVTTGSNTSCSITSPTITAPSNTPTVIGFSTGSTTRTNSWSSATAITVSSNQEYYAQTTAAAKTYTATFTKQGTGVTAISATTLSCGIDATYNGTAQATSCTPSGTTPTITVSSGYTAIGWNTSSSATTGTAVNQSITLTGNVTYYAISKKNAITLTADWNANGASLSSSSQLSCTLAEAYNNNAQATTCSITTPTITRSGFTIVGFNTSASATTALTSSSGNTMTSNKSILLTNDTTNNTTAFITGKTWYAITSKTVTITWTANGHTIGATQTSCTILNTATTCSITTPTIAEQDGRIIMGWYASDGTKFADAGVSVSVSDDATYIATSRQLTASEVEYDNTDSGLNCSDAQCAVDSINTTLS